MGELFGSNVHKCSEMFLLKFLRKLLGVGRNTHGEALRGECGQHRMHVYFFVKCIKHWIRLLSQEKGTLLQGLLYSFAISPLANTSLNLRQKT